MEMFKWLLGGSIKSSLLLYVQQAQWHWSGKKSRCNYTSIAFVCYFCSARASKVTTTKAATSATDQNGWEEQQKARTRRELRSANNIRKSTVYRELQFCANDIEE